METQTDQTFEQILVDSKDKIFRICRIYAVSPLEPQDLFQEVVFQTWKAYPTFEGKSDIGTWIYRIALNVCLNSKKKMDKRNFQMVKLDSIQFVSAESSKENDDGDKYRALHDCIASLNRVDQSMVILYLEELPYMEIGKIIGLTENHVAVRMKRTRKVLLKCISSKLQ
jgi:RNA polymerase sigma-70 factor (ECF subfamily)